MPPASKNAFLHHARKEDMASKNDAPLYYSAESAKVTATIWIKE